jgi:hypothetical protein
MNERIQKLAREAALAEGWGPGVWQTTFTEKFAELIVRECASIAQTYMSRWPEDHELTKQIKEHFGVEE